LKKALPARKVNEWMSKWVDEEKRNRLEDSSHLLRFGVLAKQDIQN